MPPADAHGTVTILGGPIFDGQTFRTGHAARFENGRLAALGPTEKNRPAGEIVDLCGDILSPGYTDLQVNGGGGVMLNDAPSVATLRRIAAAHRNLGATTILPTLITDTPEKTHAAIEAVADAIRQGVPGIAGLHLEGPHLSLARKGAHDPACIRPMEQSDLATLVDAARRLPTLMVTLAPESVTPAQVAELAGAGALVSLGHSDCEFDTALAYVQAGARIVTHLFNAMSQLGSREPGLVGAALASGHLSTGLIADGIHVHPETIRAAWAAKTGPGRIFLVSDAMAVAGTDLALFHLQGRPIHRRGGRLTLEDGTLAGANLNLTRAIHVLETRVGIPREIALQAATSVPSGLIGREAKLSPETGWPITDTIRVAADLSSASPVIDFTEVADG